MSQVPLRFLFLCTGNSARSQIAEALLHTRGVARVVAGSAGTSPAARVNPFAVAELRRRGVDWSHARPKTIDDVIQEPWDVVITVCDNAKESCPIFPGKPTSAHWGLPDPADVQGSDADKARAFRDTADVLALRIEALLALPLEKLSEAERVEKLREFSALWRTESGGDK